MTLIIGVRCTDGVVVGADGAATYATSSGQFTVIQPTSKLKIMHDCVIMGFSGLVGPGQLYSDRIESLWRDCAEIRQARLPDMQRLIINTFRQEATQTSIAAPSSLIAMPAGGLGGTAELIEWDPLSGTPESITGDTPYRTIGSGQVLADPFLAFLRRIYWQDAPPVLSQGVFAVVWTLLHAIHTNPGGVDYPIEVATLSPQDGGFVARLLQNAELDEHRESVTRAEEHLRRFSEEETS